MSKATNESCLEAREGAVRLVVDTDGRHPCRWQSIASIAMKIGCTPHTLLELIKKAEVDSGRRVGIPARDGREDEGARARERRAAPGHRDPPQGVDIFCDGGARPPVEVMVSFIDAYRGEHGVEPICNVLPIAPSGYYDRLAKRADPTRHSDRARRNETLRPEIRRVVEDNWSVYGVRRSGIRCAAKASASPGARWLG